MGLPVGNVARYPHTLFTADTVYRGDEVKDSNSDYYRIMEIQPYWWLDQFSHFQCALEKRSSWALRPTTSGTWHEDSDSAVTDPRYRHKLWFDTYKTADNMELDNGATDADVDVMLAGGDLFLDKYFLTNDVDGIIAIDRAEGQYLYDAFDYPYAEIVSVPMICCAVNKSGLTATNLVEQMEKEIERVATDYPLGSKRQVTKTTGKWVNIGAVQMWQSTVTVRYKRSNDDYVPTYPRITWGESGNPDGTYYFPNCISIEYMDTIPAVELLPINRLGNVRQRMGDTSVPIKLRCDLDLDNTTYTWKRPQTATPKTDSVNWEIILDIKHEAVYQSDEPYQTLTLSSTGPSLKVTLDSWRVAEETNGHILEVTFREYTNTEAETAYETRWGLT